MFRDELKRYATLTDPRITPREIPPLVPMHMLKPTAANKMYNARVTHRNFGGKLSESTFAPTDDKATKRNQNLLSDIHRTRYGSRLTTFNDPDHRRMGEHITGIKLGKNPSADLTTLTKSRRGVVLLYIITDTKGPKVKPPYTPGVTLLFPPNAIVTPLTFGVSRPDLPSARREVKRSRRRPFVVPSLRVTCRRAATAHTSSACRTFRRCWTSWA